MKLEVAIIERKEQLDDLIPFRVENALWGTEKFPPMYGYIGFIPQDAFYLKLICEEKNPLRVYTRSMTRFTETAVDGSLSYVRAGFFEKRME